MQGNSVNFYMYELQKHDGLPLYEWLLEQARKRGVCRCVVTRGMAGFDQYGKIHEEHFFELAPDVPVMVFMVDEKARMNSFLQDLQKRKVSVFYTVASLEYGITAN